MVNDAKQVAMDPRNQPAGNKWRDSNKNLLDSVSGIRRAIAPDRGTGTPDISEMHINGEFLRAFVRAIWPQRTDFQFYNVFAIKTVFGYFFFYPKDHFFKPWPAPATVGARGVSFPPPPPPRRRRKGASKNFPSAQMEDSGYVSDSDLKIAWSKPKRRVKWVESLMEFEFPSALAPYEPPHFDYYGLFDMTLSRQPELDFRRLFDVRIVGSRSPSRELFMCLGLGMPYFRLLS